ncbi:hypothetical protein EOVG_00038 [Emiliania huxleyi virus 88]|nr:hypothetical protein EOVG_00038 [Emiliania huxleyi virus 88]
MACAVQYNLIESNEITLKQTEITLSEITAEIADKRAFLTVKQRDLVELDNEVDALGAQLGKTRDELKKTRKSLGGVIGGFSAFAGIPLVIIAVILIVRKRRGMKERAANKPVV